MIRTTSTFLSIIFLIFTIMVSSLSAEEGEVEFEISLLGEGRDSLQSRIKFPRTKEDVSISLRCRALIVKRGKYENNLCYPNDYKLEEDFIDAIHLASRRARNTEALVNGQEASVLFFYTVEFIKNGDIEEVHVYPNDGSNVEVYGKDYYSPQHLNSTYWLEKLDFSLDCFNENPFVVTHYKISDKFAYPLQVGVENVVECEDKWVEYAKRSTFLPAMHEGKPVVSTISQIHFYVEQAKEEIINIRK